MAAPIMVVKGISHTPPTVGANPGINNPASARVIDGSIVGEANERVGNGIPDNIQSIGIISKGIAVVGGTNGVMVAAIEAGI
jgi:hypothetical protein